MKIIQDFEPACDTCPGLEPDFYITNFCTSQKVCHKSVNLFCKNKDWCRNMREHLKMQQEEQNAE